MSGPLVSVLITAYNREKYIADCIESVLASTYPDFELIVVDDCSSDNTVQICKDYARRDNRVKLYINEKNLGQFENRNLAARYANGQYLKYLDSDDLIYPTGLEVLVSMMEKYPEAGYGLCSIEQDNERIFPFLLSPKESYERHFIKNKAVFHKAPLSSIIKKEAFFSVGGFTNPHGEGDYEMWLALSRKEKLVLMPHGVVWYRIHDEQIDVNRRNDPFIAFRYFLVTLRYLSDNCPLSPAEREVVRKRTQKEMAKYIYKTFLKRSPGKAKKMYDLADFHLSEFLAISFSILCSKK